MSRNVLVVKKLKQLPDEYQLLIILGIFESFDKGLSTYKSIKSITETIVNSNSSLLFSVFYWENSIKGHAFWSSIRNEISKLDNEQ